MKDVATKPLTLQYPRTLPNWPGGLQLLGLVTMASAIVSILFGSAIIVGILVITVVVVLGASVLVRRSQQSKAKTLKQAHWPVLRISQGDYEFGYYVELEGLPDPVYFRWVRVHIPEGEPAAVGEEVSATADFPDGNYVNGERRFGDELVLNAKLCHRWNNRLPITFPFKSPLV